MHAELGRLSVYLFPCCCRVVDGWINERRKRSDNAGMLFAVRVKDSRAANFTRQIATVALLLPALCSSSSSVCTAAATWVAATAARSAVASTALMEQVNTVIVTKELGRCACCYCSSNNNRTDNTAFPACRFSKICKQRNCCEGAMIDDIHVPRYAHTAEAKEEPVRMRSTGQDSLPRDCVEWPSAATDVLSMKSSLDRSSSFGPSQSCTAFRTGHCEISEWKPLQAEDGIRFSAEEGCSKQHTCHRGRCCLESCMVSFDALKKRGSVCDHEQNADADLWTILRFLAEVLTRF